MCICMIVKDIQLLIKVVVGITIEGSDPEKKTFTDTEGKICN